MPGPLPQKNRRRRNAPTIPTTSLPAGGYGGPYPRLPRGVELGAAGKAWWAWAWRTPQAAAWSPGDHYALARRAALEDDLQALEVVEAWDFGALLGGKSASARAALEQLEALVRRLKALVGGRLAVMREARELDDRYGLTAKGLAQLRWEIVAPPALPELEEEGEPADEFSERRAQRQARGVGG